MKLKCNCCDGIYNSFDVHFTSACDNKCAHCIDKCYDGLNISKPDVNAIVKTIVENKEGLDEKTKAELKEFFNIQEEAIEVPAEEVTE